MDVRVPVRRSGLAQTDASASVGGQAVGQNAAGGSGADDDVIELFAHADELAIKGTEIKDASGYSRFLLALEHPESLTR